MPETNVQDVNKLVKKLQEGKTNANRAEAARAIGRLGEEAKIAIPILLNTLRNDKSERVRGRAALALGRLNDPSVVFDLIHTLENDSDAQVRSRAAWALGDLGELAKDAIEPLKQTADLLENKDKRFHFIFPLLKLEGLESSAAIELQAAKEKGELERWQIIRYQNLVKELTIQAKVREASDGIASVKDEAKTVETEVKSLRAKVEEQSEGQVKTDLLNITSILQNMINNQQKTIERQEETIKGLNVSLQDLMKAHQQAIQEPRITSEQYQEFKESQPEEKWIKRNLFAFVGAIGTLLGGIAAVLGWLSSILGWFN